jgi:hypothetical protein
VSTCVPVMAGGGVVIDGSEKDLHVQAEVRSSRLHRDGEEEAQCRCSP